MPKSKREKLVHLSKTAKKGKVAKEKLMSQLTECLDVFSRLFVFSVDNMRNDTFKQIRNDFRGSRFFMGKNKVMAHALGRTAGAARRSNLVTLTKYVSGNCGLLFTNSAKEEVQKYFEDFKADNYARSGFTADREFVIPSGPLSTIDFPFSMEPQLRKLGLPTSLKHGIIELNARVTVCKEGDELTPEQCKILELFQQQLAVFRVRLHCVWEKETGVLEEFEGGVVTAPAPGGDEVVEVKVDADDEDAEDDTNGLDEDDDEEVHETKRAPAKRASRSSTAAAAAGGKATRAKGGKAAAGKEAGAPATTTTGAAGAAPFTFKFDMPAAGTAAAGTTGGSAAFGFNPKDFAFSFATAPATTPSTAEATAAAAAAAATPSRNTRSKAKK